MGDFLNVTAHMLGKASGSNSTRDKQSCTKRARHDRNICGSSSQGVIALLNGNWAAHVYVNNNWICIGIFETEKEAVIVYESTTIKIWIECCNRYLQRISTGVQEPLTLEQASIDSTPSSSSVNISQVHSKQKCIRTHLFDKVLACSHVSKISRLVIPKMFAGCFPCISDGDESSSEVEPVNDVELAFYDLSMTLEVLILLLEEKQNLFLLKGLAHICGRKESKFERQSYFLQVTILRQRPLLTRIL